MAPSCFVVTCPRTTVLSYLKRRVVNYFNSVAASCFVLTHPRIKLERAFLLGLNSGVIYKLYQLIFFLEILIFANLDTHFYEDCSDQISRRSN